MTPHKTIFITGAATGIGAATARRFAAGGWYVGLADINEQGLVALADELGHENCSWHVLDVTSATQCREALTAFTKRTDGFLRVLFNNAGLLQVGAFEKISPGTHARLVDVNVNGVINMAHAGFRYLRITPEAQMISMSSASAVYGTPDFASYSATKFAVRALTEALAIEWMRHDIAVKDIMPPFVRTQMLTSQSEQPPIVERLGVNLVADDVAEAVWKAVRSKRVHQPVSRSFAMLWRVAQSMPSEAMAALMRKLAGY